MGLLKKIISWFIPEQKQVKQQTGTNLTKASSDDHIKIIYGTRETKGTIVFMNVTNPNDGDDIKNDLLHMVIVWCEGGIESIDDLLLNKISINDSKFNAKDGGRWAYAHHFENGMAGFGTSHLRAAGFDPINKGHRLDGLACSYIRLEWTTGEDAPFTGIPDVTAIIKGRKVKNLETGIVEYSENPAYCTLDYLTHPIVSKKLTETEYDLESFKVSGRICDTQVPTYQGSDRSKPLFTCNAIIDTAQSVLENTELLSKSMRALMPIINGKLTLIIEQDDAPTPFALSEKEFLGTLKYDEGSKNKRYNRVIVEYVDKELKFSEQDAVYPEPESDLANQWLAEDNGVLLEYRFKVSSCTDYYEARQMARIIAMLSREALSFDSKVAPIGLRYTVGDVVPISHKKLGWKNKPFRIIDKTDLADGTFNFSFREHQPYIYNWLSGEVRPPIPDTSLPDPRNITAPTNFSSELLNDGHVSIKWESEYSYFDIQIYKDNALILSTSSISNEFVITALDAGNYEMDVRAASKIGFRSAWVSFGFNVELPAEPTVNIDAVTYNTITLSASVAGASLGTTFEWQFLGKTDEPISSPNTAAGYNYIYTGLVPDTEYSFKVRTKNLSGVSPWVDVAVKTSLSDLLDYIDDIPLEKLSEDAQTLIEDINTQVDRLRPETENSLPSLIAKNIDALTGLNSKVEIIDSENPNNLQAQLAQSNSQITNLEHITEVLDPQNETGLPSLIKLNNLAIEKERLAIRNIELSVLSTAASYTNWRQEYERRVATGERLIDAAVYIDKDTGTIVNRAHAYTDEAFRSASLMVDGVNSKITLNAQELASSQTRISKAEAQLVVQAAQINQKANFEQVDAQIAGALAALQPAYNWQFNSGDDGFNPQSHHATGYIVATSKITSPAINYDADENPMFRLRVRKHEGAQWIGRIYFNGGNSAINLPEPTTNEWENLNVDAAGTQDYTSTINSLEFDLGACDIDFIQVGKRGANDLALADITARTTELEQDINAATGIMAQYATTNWVNALGYQTQSNVQTLIDSFNTQYSIAATLQEFNDQDIIVKANAAQTWIDGAEATIRDQVSSILNSDEGVNQRLSHAEQSLDAVAGQITSSVTQVQGLARDVSDQGIAGVLAAYNDLLIEQDLAVQGVKIAAAQERLTAISNDVENVASQTLELMALQGQNAAYLTSLNQAFASEKTARTIAERELKAEITTQSTQAVAQANERLKAVVGYCIDENGNTVDEPDAMACIAAGHEWVDGPLVQLINDYTSVFVNNQGYQTAANVQQFISTFDGEYGITATLQELDSNGTIEAAKSAQQWINAAEGTITNLITQFVTQPDGINESIAFAHEQIQANANDIENEATARQQLSVRMGEAESDLTTLGEALVTEQQARVSLGSELRIEFQAQDLAMLATANEYTRATSGYCVDANGDIVDEEDAVACEAAGHTWVNLPSVTKAVELSSAYVNEQGYQTQSNVNQLIDTFNSTYSITATLQEFNQNDTLQKANNAQQFINAAEGYIAERITLFNASEGGVDAKFSDVQQRLDAAEGAVTTSILQIQGLEFGQQAQGLNDVIAAYNQFKQDHDLAKQNVKVALANEKLQAQTTDIESLAQQQLELAAIFNNNNSIITSLDKAIANQYKSSVVRDQRYQATFEDVTARFSDVTTALATIDEANTLRDIEFESFVADTIASFDEVSETFASQNQAFSTLQQTLTSKIENDTEAAIATAQEYTRTAVGYCLDAQGNITSSNDAVQCVADGGSWVNGPLAEFIANMQISDGANSASIKQLRQVFKTVDGQLVARGGWQLDNNGRAVGVVGYNDGEIANLDLVGDVIRQGVMVGNTFVPTSYVDNSDPANPVHIFKGKMILGDNYEVESEDDIRAQDGTRGSVQIEVATSTGVWYDSTANNSLPSAPVIHDRVTIYKASDPAVQTTKRYTGSTWQSYALHIHGSAIIEDTLDAKVVRAGTKLSSPKIIGGEFAVTDPSSDYLDIVGRSTPFGPSADLISWYGPKINGVTWNSAVQEPIYSGMSKSNAVSYKTNNGSFYFGGTFQAGTLSISRQATNTSGTLTVSTGAFTIPGGTTAVTIAASVSANGWGTGGGSCPANLFKPSSVVTIERLVGSTWQQISGNNAAGRASCEQEGPEVIISVSAGATTNTNLTVSSGQLLHLRAVANTVAFPYYEGDEGNVNNRVRINGTRAVSIVITGNN